MTFYSIHWHQAVTQKSIPALNSHQKFAISNLIEGQKDIFINLPTGLPLVIDHLRKRRHLCCCVATQVAYSDISCLQTLTSHFF